MASGRAARGNRKEWGREKGKEERAGARCPGGKRRRLRLARAAPAQRERGGAARDAPPPGGRGRAALRERGAGRASRREAGRSGERGAAPLPSLLSLPSLPSLPLPSPPSFPPSPSRSCSFLLPPPTPGSPLPPSLTASLRLSSPPPALPSLPSPFRPLPPSRSLSLFLPFSLILSLPFPRSALLSRGRVFLCPRRPGGRSALRSRPSRAGHAGPCILGEWCRHGLSRGAAPVVVCSRTPRTCCQGSFSTRISLDMETATPDKGSLSNFLMDSDFIYLLVILQDQGGRLHVLLGRLTELNFKQQNTQRSL